MTPQKCLCTENFIENGTQECLCPNGYYKKRSTIYDQISCLSNININKNVHLILQHANMMMTLAF